MIKAEFEDVGYDLTEGFAWAVIVQGEERYTIQARLMRGAKGGYIKKSTTRTTACIGVCAQR